MWAYLVVAVVLPVTILGYPVESCGGGLPTPTDLQIEGCPSSPCHVNRGDLISFEKTFIANEASGSLTMEIEFTALGETHNFPLPPELSDVCGQLSVGSCPVQIGQELIQSAVIPAEVDLHDGIPAQFRVRIYNTSGNAVSCAIIHAVID